MTDKIKISEWKVHTPSLLKEIVNNPTTSILSKPLQIFGGILYEVAERASELNDPVLNHLMMRLTLYEVADPYSKEYSLKTVKTVEKLCQKFKKKTKIELCSHAKCVGTGCRICG